MGIFGKPDVERLEARRSVRGLIRALNYKDDTEVRRDAVVALGKLGDARAVKPLIRVLSDDSNTWYLREVAAWNLGKLGNVEAVEPLINALRNPDNSPWSKGLISSLGSLGDPRGIEPLIQVLRENPYHANYASVALKGIGEAAVDDLIQFLKEEDCTGSQYAVSALGYIGGERATEGIVQALRSHPNFQARARAAACLGEIGGPRAAEALVEAYRDEGGSFTRQEIGKALRKLSYVLGPDGAVSAPE